MTGTITPTVDTTNQRIGVQLSSWAAADGPIVVKRVHPDTSEWTVRGFGNTSGGQAFAWDYEAPFGQSVTYYAFDGSTKVVSPSANLNLQTCWLTAPGLPAVKSQIRLKTVPTTVAWTRPSATLRPLGRATAVVLSDVLKSPEFDVSALTCSFTESTTLESTVRSGATLLLRMPLTRWPWQYVAVSKMSESPVSEKLPPNGAAAGDPNTWSVWSLTCTVVDSPVGGIFGDPTASYAAVVSTYATYAALKTAKATYLDVLKGVP